MQERLELNKNNDLLKDKIKLDVIELFSGMGAQIRGVNNTSLFDSNVVATSDLDKEVVVSYAAIHCGLTNQMIEEYTDYPSKEQMIEDLTSKRLGYDFKEDKPYNWGKLAKRKNKTKGIEKYWLADKISNNLGDIIQIQQLPKCDLLTYSFPCQDISIAGKQAGIVEKKTRSGLLYEVERLLERVKNTDMLPKYLLLENVKNLVGKKFIEQFNEWIKRLDELGYNTYWEVINSKNCGIPQNRERVFALSIRKDVDNEKFEFPKPFDLGYRLRDFLEDEVDEKYYLSQEIQDRLQITDETFSKSILKSVEQNNNENPIRVPIDKSYNNTQPIEIANCITAREDRGVSNRRGEGTAVLEIQNTPNELQQSLTLSGGKWDKINESCRRVYSENGIAPTLHTCNGGNTEPKVVFEERRDEGVRLFKGDYVGTLRTIDSSGDKRVAEKINGKIAVRKLTPKEAHRLMGFNDEDYEKCKSIGMSDSQGYKQTGNSIVTTCIMLIMEHLYKAQYDNEYKCFDEVFLENFIKPQVD